MLERCEQTNGEPPEKAMAAAGDCNKANLQLGDDQTELFIKTTKSWKRRKEIPEKYPPWDRIPHSLGQKSGWNGNSGPSGPGESMPNMARQSSRSSANTSIAVASGSCYG